MQRVANANGVPMRLSVALTVLAFMAMVLTNEPVSAAFTAPTASAVPWWAWVLALFVVTFMLEIVAVVGGVGGGVLFGANRQRPVPVPFGFREGDRPLDRAGWRAGCWAHPAARRNGQSSTRHAARPDGFRRRHRRRNAWLDLAGQRHSNCAWHHDPWRVG